MRLKGQGPKELGASGMVSLTMTCQVGLVRMALQSGRGNILGENGAFKALEGLMRLENRCSGGKVVKELEAVVREKGSGSEDHGRGQSGGDDKIQVGVEGQ